MSNLLFDGFELFTVAGSTYPRWPVYLGGTAINPANNTSVTRTAGCQSMVLGNATSNGGRALNATPSHIFMGVAFIPAGSNVRGTAECNLSLYDGATAQIGWRNNGDGSISVYRGSTSAATLIGTTATGLVPFILGTPTSADFKMIELEVVFATGATGSVKLRIGNVEVLNISSVQTANSGTAQCTHVVLRSSGTSSLSEYYDDFYINDDSGSAPHNTYYGEAFAVEKQVPNAVGNYTEWSRNTGSNNYQAVDDYFNSDTDYVNSNTLNQRDSYNSADLVTASGTIVGVEHNMVIRKDDIAPRAVTPLYRTGGSDYLGTEVSATGTYTLSLQRQILNPNTSAAWTVSEINALEHGIKLTT